VSQSKFPGTTRLEKMPAPVEPPATLTTLFTQGSSLESLLQELRVKGGGQKSFAGANFSSAWEAIWANRTRSFLTLLGIIIGVAAVIGALTLAQGVGGYFQNVIAGEGVNTISISGSPATNRVTRLRQTHPSLTVRDLQNMQSLSHILAISPVLRVGGQVVYGNQNWRTSGIQGVSTDFQTIQDWQLVDGLWFSTAQDVGAEPVAVLGDTVMHNLFDASGAEPVGKQIRIGNQLFRVVGVLAPKGGPGQDDAIFMPYRTVQERLTNNTYFGQINVEVDDAQNIDQVVQAITLDLELNHHIPRGTPDDFQTQTSAQLLQQSSQITQAIALLLTGLAAISLSVGGIGVMNIMLVSVTERTREIGIRISIGARRRDIRNQFLTEALFLCLLGGLIGMLFGIFIGWLTIRVIIAAIVGSSAGATVPLVITPTTLILPFAVTAAIGVVFGLYPAIRASHLDPIVALRRAK
jgi:putative ABC transport system permease protein